MQAYSPESTSAVRRGAIWKRHRTHEAFGAFWTILVMTAFMAFTTFTLPTMLSWRQEQETKAGEPTGTAVIQTTFEIQITPG